MNKFFLILFFILSGCSAGNVDYMYSPSKIDHKNNVACYTYMGEAISCVHIPGGVK
jgi:hypothetical protein